MSYLFVIYCHPLINSIHLCSGGHVWKSNLIGNFFPVVNQAYVSVALNLVLLCRSVKTPAEELE